MEMENFSKNQNEILKQWLRRYQELQRYANRLFDRAHDLRGRIESARSSRLDGMPHGSRGDADRIGAVFAEMAEIEEEAAEAQESATAVRREISEAIRKIHGPHWADKREVLRLRYVDGLKWEDCAERMFGDDPRYWDRADIFLRRCYKIHGEALAELAQHVPLSAEQEEDIESTEQEDAGNGNF